MKNNNSHQCHSTFKFMLCLSYILIQRILKHTCNIHYMFDIIGKMYVEFQICQRIKEHLRILIVAWVWELLSVDCRFDWLMTIGLNFNDSLVNHILKLDEPSQISQVLCKIIIWARAPEPKICKMQWFL